LARPAPGDPLAVPAGAPETSPGDAVVDAGVGVAGVALGEPAEGASTVALGDPAEGDTGGGVSRASGLGVQASSTDSAQSAVSLVNVAHMRARGLQGAFQPFPPAFLGRSPRCA